MSFFSQMFTQLRFTYEQESHPEEFFIPYVWQLVLSRWYCFCILSKYYFIKFYSTKQRSNYAAWSLLVFEFLNLIFIIITEVHSSFLLNWRSHAHFNEPCYWFLVFSFVCFMWFLYWSLILLFCPTPFLQWIRLQFRSHKFVFSWSTCRSNYLDTFFFFFW